MITSVQTISHVCNSGKEVEDMLLALFGFLPMVTLVILPIVPLVANGTIGLPMVPMVPFGEPIVPLVEP